MVSTQKRNWKKTGPPNSPKPSKALKKIIVLSSEVLKRMSPTGTAETSQRSNSGIDCQKKLRIKERNSMGILIGGDEGVGKTPS